LYILQIPSTGAPKMLVGASDPGRQEVHKAMRNLTPDRAAYKHHSTTSM
jgi:hypothetical protein